MTTFEADFSAAISRQDGPALAKTLAAKLNRSTTGTKNPQQPQARAMFEARNEGLLKQSLQRLLMKPSPDDAKLWAEVAVSVWRREKTSAGSAATYKAQHAVVVAINRVADKCGRWILPVMARAAADLRILAGVADDEDGHGNSKGKKQKRCCLEEAVRAINRSFTLCLNDRNPVPSRSRKWGVYQLVGELFKIYFKLGNVALARSTLKVVQQQEKQLPSLDKFPKSHAVTYLYFTGVLLFIDEDYDRCRAQLARALAMCPRDAARAHANKEAILLYLIPAQLLCTRRTPSALLFERYARLAHVYCELISAVMTGDLQRFDRVVLERRGFFIRKHLYLAVSRIRMLVYTRLFRRVYVARDRSNRIATPVFSRALAFSLGIEIASPAADPGRPASPSTEEKSGEEPGATTREEVLFPAEVSGEQVECYLTQLIYTGQMKGYISRSHQMVVLSNKEAFPKRHGTVTVDV